MTSPGDDSGRSPIPAYLCDDIGVLVEENPSLDRAEVERRLVEKFGHRPRAPDFGEGKSLLREVVQDLRATGVPIAAGGFAARSLDVTPDYPTVVLVEREFEDGERRTAREIGLAQDGTLRVASYVFTPDPETKKVRRTTSYAVVVNVPFHPRRYRDESGGSWVELEEIGGAGTIRGPLPEFLRRVRERFSLGPTEGAQVAKWVEALPVTGEITTTLRLREPGKGLDWRVPRAFGRVAPGRRDSVSRLAGWYRPRDRTRALAHLKGLKPFLEVSPKLKIVLYWVAGSVVTAIFAPWRPRVELNLTGDSGTGKTTSVTVCIAVLWALGGLEKETHGRDAVESGFRWLDLLAATNLPVVLDETSLTPEEREDLRAALSGGQSGRGGTDLLQREYARDANVATTTNRADNDIDLAASELHGTNRRRITEVFESEDKELIGPKVRNFNEYLGTLRRDLVDGPDEPDGGGAGLWLLRGMDAGTLAEIRAIATDPERSDRQAVVDVGAAILGMQTVGVPEDEPDPAGGAFLGFLSAEKARYGALLTDLVVDFDDSHGLRRREKLRRPSDPIFSRIRVVADEQSGREWNGVNEGDVYVYVAADELRAYAAECRRAGRMSPFSTLPSLRALSSLTGQRPDDICKRGRDGSFLKKVGGEPMRVARVLLSNTPEDPTSSPPPAEQRQLGEGGP